MNTLRLLWALAACALPAVAFSAPLPPPDDRDGEHWHHAIHGAPSAQWEGQTLTLSINLENSPGFTLEPVEGTNLVEARYRMGFNNVADGWSWTPLADPAQEDYYRYKFLPLKSVQEEKASLGNQEIAPGEWREIRNLWRYDYFIAFDNLYDFYPRQVDNDAGFVARFKWDTPTPVIEMRATLRLTAPVSSESNNFWKADLSQPADITLRKRYLIGKLVQVIFVNKGNGQVLATILPGATAAHLPLQSDYPGGGDQG